MLSFQGRLHPCAAAFGKGGCVIIKIQVFSYKPVKIQVSFVSVWNLCCVKDPRPELLDNPRLFRNKGNKKKKEERLGVKFRFLAGEKKTLKAELRRRKSAEEIGALPPEYAQTCWGRNPTASCRFQPSPRRKNRSKDGESLSLGDNFRGRKRGVRAAQPGFPSLPRSCAPRTSAARSQARIGDTNPGCKGKSAWGRR